MITKNRLGLLFSAVGAITLVVAGAPAAALQQSNQPSSEETFVNIGRWVIVQDERARVCELRLTADPQVVLRYRMADGRAPVLALQRKSGRFFTGMIGDVEWAFDGARFAGSQSNNGYSLSAGSRDVEAGFRSAKTLFVTHGGGQVAQIDLKTSSAGFRLLKQCSEQWRYIPWYRRLASANYRELEAPTTRDVPTAPSTASRSATSVPLPPSPTHRTIGLPPPPNRAARAINPASWIRSDDNLPWPSRGFSRGKGVLRYTLLVNEAGRAEECEVNTSTGSRRFDRQACRLLMDRARFEPARSSNGQTIDGRYSASFRFAEE